MSRAFLLALMFPMLFQVGGSSLSFSGRPCEMLPGNPTILITSPSDSSAVGDVSVAVTSTATDSGSGVKTVTVYYKYCGGSFTSCGALTSAGTDSASPFSVTWTFPSCEAAPDEYFKILARSEDNCGNFSALDSIDVRLTGRGC